MNKEVLLAECQFKAVRSSGPGGQHVNKTSTKIVLRWDLQASDAFDEVEKTRLSERLTYRLTKDGVLLLTNDKSRSQHSNKEEVIKLFLQLLEKALKRPKKRKKTRPSRNSKLKRLKNKKRHAEKKANRKPPPF